MHGPLNVKFHTDVYKWAACLEYKPDVPPRNVSASTMSVICTSTFLDQHTLSPKTPISYAVGFHFS